MQPWKFETSRDLGLAPQDRLRSLKRESGLISTVLHRTWWSAARVYLKLWHSLKIEGREFLPVKPPFVMVANHASHLDVLVLAASLAHAHRDRIFPIAAGEVFFSTPATSAFSALMLNALPMWRKKCGSHHMEQLRERLVEEPCAYILFPEGTRSRDGAMSSFKAGLGMLVAGTNVPVIPCSLSGCHVAMPPDVRLPRRRPITLSIGAPLLFPDVASDREGWRHVAASAEQAVRTLAGCPIENGAEISSREIERE
ncbi:MAG: 1-acyl-sn-glycerol-3-phosphate acyltransferase [Planctomycetia bacterium]|nr:1-acyl-sn-glycerol-3-phosphate acyltransferase [Planctomycetia bacterium]